jgi:hypothetical protein
MVTLSLITMDKVIMNSINSNIYCSNFLLRILIFFLMSFFIITNCELAIAANNNGKSSSSSSSSSPTTTSDPIGEQLCAIVKSLSGNTAKSISIIALFAVGFGLFMGKVNWGVALTTAAGVVIVFGAGSLVAWLAGTNAADSSACFMG